MFQDANIFFGHFKTVLKIVLTTKIKDSVQFHDTKQGGIYN